MKWLKRIFRPAAEPEPTFSEWFNKQGFRNFKASEFTNYFSRPRNQEPPRELWPNIVPTLRVVDDLRDLLGSPIKITSSYRSPEYNEWVGGVSRSYHLQFKALDIQVVNFRPQKVAQLLRKMRSNGKFSGGIGVYQTFVHLDTRGSDADW